MPDRSPLDMVREFRKLSGGTDDPWSAESIRLRRSLIREESEEVDDELVLLNWKLPGRSLTRLAKELADLIYVTYGTADALGIDLDRVIEEVHASNLTKFPAVINDDGKVMKGPGYVPPNLDWVNDD